MPDTTYLADPGDEEEFSFVKFVSLLGVTPDLAGTFSPGESAPLGRSWVSWIESVFAPQVAPAFVDSYHRATASQVEEICELDRKLDQGLTAAMASRSHAAAASFFEGKDEMQANREWVRYTSSVDRGEAPGNLPIVFAFQSALYHLPLTPALTAYAWFEFRSRYGNGLPPEATAEEKEIFEHILPQVAVAVSGKIDDSDDGPGLLRSI